MKHVLKSGGKQNSTSTHAPCLLHREKALDDEQLNLVEEFVHRGHAVQRHEVQLQLPDSPLAPESLVVILCPFLPYKCITGRRGWGGGLRFKRGVC